MAGCLWIKARILTTKAVRNRWLRPWTAFLGGPIHSCIWLHAIPDRLWCQQSERKEGRPFSWSSLWLRRSDWLDRASIGRISWLNDWTRKGSLSISTDKIFEEIVEYYTLGCRELSALIEQIRCISLSHNTSFFTMVSQDHLKNTNVTSRVHDSHHEWEKSHVSFLRMLYSTINIVCGYLDMQGGINTYIPLCLPKTRARKSSYLICQVSHSIRANQEDPTDADGQRIQSEFALKFVRFLGGGGQRRSHWNNAILSHREERVLCDSPFLRRAVHFKCREIIISVN